MHACIFFTRCEQVESCAKIIPLSGGGRGRTGEDNPTSDLIQFRGGGYSPVKACLDVLQKWVYFLFSRNPTGPIFHEKSVHVTVGLVFKILWGYAICKFTLTLHVVGAYLLPAHMAVSTTLTNFLPTL